MDKYLAMFSGQLDDAFKAASLFPDKKKHKPGLLKRTFIAWKSSNKQLKESSTTGNTSGVKYCLPKI